MTTATRYWLFQIPGWVITIALLLGLRQSMDLPIWAGVGVMVLLVVKDAILYPFLKPGYERNVKNEQRETPSHTEPLKHPVPGKMSSSKQMQSHPGNRDLSGGW